MNKIKRANERLNFKGSNQKTNVNAGAINKAFDLFHYAEESQKLQSNLTAVMKPAQKIIRLHRCFGCKKHFGIKRMSCLLIFCRNCFAAAQDKKQTAQSNFIDRALNECRIFLGVRI